MSTSSQTDIRRSIAAAERELEGLRLAIDAHERDRKRAADFCERMRIDPGADPVAAIEDAAATVADRIAAAERKLVSMGESLDAMLASIAAARNARQP